jgi:hypothetical protein
MPDQNAASGPPMVTMAIEASPTSTLRPKPWISARVVSRS